MKKLSFVALSFVVLAAYPAEPQRPQPLKSGLEFTGADARRLQADDFANPGMLWVTRGEKLWREPAGQAAKSCAACRELVVAC